MMMMVVTMMTMMIVNGGVDTGDRLVAQVYSGKTDYGPTK